MTESAAGTSGIAKGIGTILNVVIVLGAAVYFYSKYNPDAFSFAKGENKLEAALKIGQSDRKALDDFKSAGGLGLDSTWLGFHPMNIKTVYDAHGKLGMAVIDVQKVWPTAKSASIDALESALSSQCGTSWKRLSPDDALVVQSLSGALKCSALDQGESSIEVTLVSQTAANEASDQPATEEPQSQPAVAAAPVSAEPPPSIKQDTNGSIYIHYGAKHVLAGKIIRNGPRAYLQLDAPVRVVNKIDVNGKDMGSDHDGETYTQFEVDLGANRLPASGDGVFEAEITCSEANCSITALQPKPDPVQ